MKSVKPCYFVGSSKKAISAMPKDVKAAFGGRGVLEVIEDHEGDTCRAVYTVRFATAIYVLHAFQKKSKSGIATSKHELDLNETRFKDAEALHRHFALKEK